MQARVQAIVRSLIAVAWADGRMTDQETQVIEVLIAAYDLTDDEAQAIRDYASQERTLADLPLAELGADDRRLLLQQAVIVAHADGHQCNREGAVFHELAKALRIPADEAEQLLAAGRRRAERLATLV